MTKRSRNIKIIRALYKEAKSSSAPLWKTRFWTVIARSGLWSSQIFEVRRLYDLGSIDGITDILFGGHGVITKCVEVKQ